MRETKLFKNAATIALIIVPSFLFFMVILQSTQGTFRKVYGDSMYPNYCSGDVLYTRRFTTGDVQVGQVVGISNPRRPGETVVHRISRVYVSRGETYIQTKGDNNEYEDPWVLSAEDIEYEVLVRVTPGIVWLFVLFLPTAGLLAVLFSLLVFYPYIAFSGLARIPRNSPTITSYLE